MYTDMMKCIKLCLFALALALTLLAGKAHADLTWESCGDENDLLELKSLSYQPEVPVRGEYLNITASGTLKEVVDEGSMANVVVKWGLIRVPVPPVDICEKLDELPDQPFACPLPAQDFSVDNLSFMLPSNIPNGKFDVKVKLQNQEKQQITCLAIKLTF